MRVGLALRVPAFLLQHVTETCLRMNHLALSIDKGGQQLVAVIARKAILCSLTQSWHPHHSSCCVFMSAMTRDVIKNDM